MGALLTTCRSDASPPGLSFYSRSDERRWSARSVTVTEPDKFNNEQGRWGALGSPNPKAKYQTSSLISCGAMSEVGIAPLRIGNWKGEKPRASARRLGAPHAGGGEELYVRLPAGTSANAR